MDDGVDCVDDKERLGLGTPRHGTVQHGSTRYYTYKCCDITYTTGGRADEQTDGPIG